MASSVGGKLLEDEDLLDEVTYLVEYSHPLMGSFEEKYLELPKEVPITVMKEHQRYFAVLDQEERLMPYFITIANTIPRDDKVVIQGNERVIRARLEDARFYYVEDVKVPLEQRAEQLKNVVFHSKLGTSWEKVERFTKIGLEIANMLGLSSSEVSKLREVSYLCKADLVSGMVGEFPELQGVMGRDYALKQGKDPEVAQAIYEHYLPVKAGGAIPSGLIGAILSIADKLDTIVGCFGVGLIPTGTADPFALRRQTIGIIRIILEKDMPLSLRKLVRFSIPLLKNWMTEPEKEVEEGVINFFKGRFEHLLTDEDYYGYAPEVVRSAIAIKFDVLPEDLRRIKALHEFTKRADFEDFTLAFKRIVNIIKEPEGETPSEIIVSEELLQEPAEIELYKAFVETRDALEGLIGQGDYSKAIDYLASLRSLINNFFDSVLVMAKDEKIRANRVNLLRSVKGLFEQIADFRMF